MYESNRTHLPLCVSAVAVRPDPSGGPETTIALRWRLSGDVATEAAKGILFVQLPEIRPVGGVVHATAMKTSPEQFGRASASVCRHALSAAADSPLALLLRIRIGVDAASLEQSADPNRRRTAMSSRSRGGIAEPTRANASRLRDANTTGNAARSEGGSASDRPEVVRQQVRAHFESTGEWMRSAVVGELLGRSAKTGSRLVAAVREEVGA